jgi:hypothetical protein
MRNPLSDDFPLPPTVPTDAPPKVFKAWLQQIQTNQEFWRNPDVHLQIADQLIHHLPSDRSFAEFFSWLDFSYLRLAQTKAIIDATSFCPTEIGTGNCRIILDWIASLDNRIDTIRRELQEQIDRVADSMMSRAPNFAAPIIVAAAPPPIEDHSEQIANLQTQVNLCNENAESLTAEISELRNAMDNMKRWAVAEAEAAQLPSDWDLPARHRDCVNIFAAYDRHCEILSSPRFEINRLPAVMAGLPNARWSSDPRSIATPSITITLKDTLCIVINKYRLKSAFACARTPAMRSWTLFGDINGEWHTLDEVSTTNVLCDGATHEFEVSNHVPVTAVRLCMVGRNRCGSKQLHLAEFVLAGDVFGPHEIIQARGIIPKEDPEFAWRSVCNPTQKIARKVIENEEDHLPIASNYESQNEQWQTVVNGDAETAGEREEKKDIVNAEGTENADRLKRMEEEQRENDLVIESHREVLDEINSTIDDGSVTKLSIIETNESEKAPCDVTEHESTQGQFESPPLATVGASEPNPACATSPVESATPIGDNCTIVDENLLFPDQTAPTVAQRPALITEMVGLEEVRQLGVSRFGTVRLVRRAKSGGGFEYFAAKYYNMGDNKEGTIGFHDRMRGFLDLFHPHVMPLIGMVNPTNTAGPILLTPYSQSGSLEDVLDRVRRNDPPPFWNDATKLRMIVSLVTGLNYLHNHGIVHRELKPTDLIVESDGSLRICGYATSVLEEHRFTKATQVGGPSYMAPEIFDDEHDGQKLRDPKTDIFSFGLIVYELLCGPKVFPSTMSAATIMRRAMSTRASDRPVIPDSLHPILRELMSRSWIPTATKRPSFETLWKRMRGARFKLFPAIDVHFSSLPNTKELQSKSQEQK